MLASKEMYDRVERIIQKSKFNGLDVDNGTTGFCGTFALALHRHLNRLGIENTLIVVHEKGKDFSNQEQPETDAFWTHFAVRVGEHFYDVRGKIDTKKLTQYGHLDISEIAEIRAIKMLRDLNLKYRKSPSNPDSYSGKLYRDWKRRLYAPLEEQ